MSDFYSNAFGWNLQQLGPEMGHYVLATTVESDEKGRPKRPGAINGGLYEKTPDMPAQHPSVVVGTKNIKESIEKVKKAGGKILGEPMAIPGVGTYVSFVDTEGNRLSIIEPIDR